MFHTVAEVTGGILLANLHLLFWLSLFPFVTGWMSDTKLAPIPTAAYGVVLLMAALAYFLLQQTIIRQQRPGSLLARAIGRDLKGKLSPVLNAAAIASAFFWPWLSAILYAAVASMWLVPDRRIEHKLADTEGR